MAGNFEQDFAAAIAGLQGSGNYNPLPQQTQSMQFQPPQQLDYKALGGGPGVMLPPGAFGGGPAGGGFADGLWGFGSDLLHGLMGVSSLVTNQVADWTDGSFDWKDIPLADSLGQGFKGQADAWTDGKFSLADAPVIGSLIGMGRDGKTTHDIFNNIGYTETEADPNAGWNPFQHRKGNFDIGDLGEFAGDVLLDPLTYLTFGAGSAIKAGAQGAAKTAAEQLAAHGLEATALRGAERSIVGIGKYGLKVGAPELGSIAEHVGGKVAAKAGEEAGIAARVAIENAGKTARAAAQNSLVGASVPFTNKIATFGKKPGFMQIADHVIGDIGKTPVVRALEGLGLDAEKQKAFLKSAYGVEDAGQMTSQMLQHFGENIGKVSKGEDLFHVFKPVTDEFMTYHRADPLGILDNVADPRVKGPVTPAIERILQNPLLLEGRHTTPEILGNARSFLTPSKADVDLLSGYLPEVVSKIGGDVKNAYGAFTEPMGKGFDDLANAFRNMDNTATTAFAPFEKATVSVENANKTLKGAQDMFGLHQFAQDMGGSSPLGRFFSSKVSALNPRSLGSADPFINDAAGKIRDAEGFMRSNQGWTQREIEGIQKISKGLPQSDLAKIPYMLEGKAPAGQTMDKFLEGVTNKAQLQQVADYLKGMFGRQAEREMGAGALTKTIDNYFPHVLNKEGMSKDALQAVLNDPELSKLMGRSSANQFNQARKGFDSFAQLDEAISGLQQALKTETDPTKIAKITQTIEQLQNLFVRDPIKATAMRFYKGIQAESMSLLQKDLRGMGTLRLPEDIAKDGAAALTPDFVRIDTSTAQKLGLPPGTAMHKEVLQGLEKLPNLFTDAGLNKFVENMTSAINLWKNMVTTYRPSHHFGNMMGNIANTTMAGVKPSSYKTAGELLLKAKKGALSEVERKFMQEAVDKGILGGGQLLDVIDPLRLAREGGTLQNIERKVVGTGWAKIMRGMGDNIEDLSRLATYVHGKKTTGSAKLAAEMVRKYLFNWGELTSADKFIKLGAPFWMWTKNNLPLQLGELLRQPRYAVTIEKWQQALNTDNQEGVALPDYIQKDYMRIPGTDSFMNPRLPEGDIQKLDNPLGMALGLLSPGLKMPFEVAMNKQVFSGAPIDPYKTDNGSYDPARLGGYLGSAMFPMGRDAANLFGGNILDSVAGFLVGRPAHIDPAKEARNQMFQRKDEMRKAKAKAKAGR